MKPDLAPRLRADNLTVHRGARIIVTGANLVLNAGELTVLGDTLGAWRTQRTPAGASMPASCSGGRGGSHG